ncbi:MAG: PAS-domain containing protein [Alphaproteobacteria bacterium]|jgi:PAS domain-containing protein
MGGDQKDTEKALKKAEEKATLLETTLGTMAQGVAVYDSDLRAVSFNDQIKKTLDLPSGFLRVGLSLEDIIRYPTERGEYGAPSSGSGIITGLGVIA